MSNTKVLVFAHALLALSRYVVCQLEPNGTLYIPGISVIEDNVGPVTAPLVVSQVTVQGASTVFQVIDPIPTSAGPDITATLELSPSGAHLVANIGEAGIGPADITCSISGGDSSCQLSADLIANGATVPFTSPFSEATSGVPVVAIGVASGSRSGFTTPTTSGSSLSQTAGPSATSNSSSSSSSSSQTAPAAAASTSQPSSAMALHSPVVIILVGFSLVLASL